MSEAIIPPPNPEIEELIKEYEKREQADQRPVGNDFPEKASGMAASLMKHSKGVVKTTKQADGILIFFIVLCLIISIFLFSGMSTYTDEVPPAFINKPHLPLQ